MKLIFQHIFRNSYLALCILLICCVTANGQVAYDSTKVLQDINALGYRYKNIATRDDGMLRIPRDTIRLAFSDSGAIAYKRGILYLWNGRHWISSGLKTTILPGTLIDIIESGQDSVTLAVDSLTLAALYGGKVDSVVKRGDTLRYFVNGDSTLIGTVSGGGEGSGNLNQVTAAGNRSTRNIFLGPVEIGYVGDSAAIYGENIIIGASNINPTTAGGNISVGKQSMQSLTSGNANVAVGGSALPGLTEGNGNVAIGTSSGLDVQNTSESIFIGLASKGADNLINATAIGPYSFVGQSNTIVLGDTSLYAGAPTKVGIGTGYPKASLHVKGNGLKAAVFVDGNVGIGTQNPGAVLEVAGAPRIRTDSAQAGWVLTSTDANGTSQWRPPGSGITTGQLTDSLNARGNTYKLRNDSAGNAGYATLFQRNKMRDSLALIINEKANSASPTFTGKIALSSTSGGIELPQMTDAQMNAIPTPAPGTQVFNTTYNAVCTYLNDWGWWSFDPGWLTYNGWNSNSEFITTGNSATTTTVGDFYAQIANSGTVTSSAGLPNAPGIIQLSSASSATARASLISDVVNLQSMTVGGGRLLFEIRHQVPTLSSASETFRFFTGLSNNNQVVSGSSIAFLYDSTGANTGSAATGRWQVVCSNGTTRSYTTTDSTVTPGQFYILRAVINPAGSQVDFYINGALVKSETNSIPNAAMSPVAVLTKSNGTTPRTVLVDYIRMRQKFTNPRP